jgi:hypothetical protein
MQRLEVSGAVRPLKGSLGVKRLSVMYMLDAKKVKHLHVRHAYVM